MPEPFAAVFRAHADAHDASMTFERFMALALYHEHVGYYRSRRGRVGYGAGTDFFTASTSGPIFGELVSAACIKLLGPKDPRDYTFIEIGSETSGGVLAGVAHPFTEVKVRRIGEPLDLPPRCVVFSNELFDAQPFRRFVFRGGTWRELGVALRNESLVEIELSAASIPMLPAEAPEGYVIDAPLAAASLATEIARQPWDGLFLAFDYGKSWREITEACPIGTARGYFRHQQTNELLARPGEQDLTCHVCWDWLVEALTSHCFKNAQVESQEAFFVHHASDFIAAATSTDAARFSQRKLSLMQLLHPTHLGQKFQVLHAVREG